MKGKFLSICIAFALLGIGRVSATTFLQMDSTYLGDGWFQYHMQVMKDPFFTNVDLQLYLTFTNQIDQGTSSPDWTNSYSPAYNQSGWISRQSYPPRPYEETFLMQSAETSYRVGKNYDGAEVLVSLYLSALNPNWRVAGNIVGYARFPALVPCAPEQADGSPANFSYSLKLLPDISIQQLIQTNGSVYGVDFIWDSESTFVLQASADAISWTNVAYIWSTPPETLWTTNTPLNGFGQFFRVEMVADGHATNLPPLDSVALLAKSIGSPVTVASTAAIPRVSGCQIIDGKVAVSIVAPAGQDYTVSAMDNHGTVYATQSLTADNGTGTACFDVRSLPKSVFFQVATSVGQ